MYIYLVRIPVYTKRGGKRCYTKIDYCYFCSKRIVSKVSRHYRNKHQTEREVMEYFLLKRKEGQQLKDYENDRTKMLKKLQMLGNYKHNIDVCILVFANTLLMHDCNLD